MKHIFSSKFWNERDIQLYIGQVLRYGVIVSCTITLLGSGLYLFQKKGQIPEYKSIPKDEYFAGAAQYLRGFGTIMSGVLDLNGAAIIQLGVVVLIATPIVRVAFSAVSFLIEKDYMYVVITLIVLAIIISNMLLGLH